MKEHQGKNTQTDVVKQFAKPFLQEGIAAFTNGRIGMPLNYKGVSKLTPHDYVICNIKESEQDLLPGYEGKCMLADVQVAPKVAIPLAFKDFGESISFKILI